MVVALSQPTRLPNGQLQSESLQWIFLWTPGYISICFCASNSSVIFQDTCRRFQLFSCGDQDILFLMGSQTISIRVPRRPKTGILSQTMMFS